MSIESCHIVGPRFIKSPAASNLAFNEKVKKLILSGRNISHFAFGESPFPVPDVFVENLQKNAHKNSYLPMQGIPDLRIALAAFHLKYDGMDLDIDNFITCPGSKEIIYQTMAIFNGTILLPSPSWTTYEPQAYLAGKRPIIINTDASRRWKISPKEMAKALQSLDSFSKKEYKLLIFNNPGNPSGQCYTEQEIVDLGAFCRANKIIVLSDEIYARLTFNRKHFSIFKSYPEGTILTSGFSKWSSAGGWRLGYAYVPSSLRPIFDAIRSNASHTYSCAPAPMQFAVARALNVHGTELNDYMESCTTILKWVGEYCYRELTSVGVKAKRSEAGYYFMPDFEVIREGLAENGIFTSVEMTQAILQEADVALMGSEAFLRPAEELSVRFCFVCFDGSQALRNFRNLKQGLLKLREYDEEFVKRNCDNLVQGIQRLKFFVKKYKK